MTHETEKQIFEHLDNIKQGQGAVIAAVNDLCERVRSVEAKASELRVCAATQKEQIESLERDNNTIRNAIVAVTVAIMASIGGLIWRILT